MDRRKKAVCTLGLCAALPVVFAIPGISQYPLTLAGGIVAAAVFINIPESVDTAGVQENEISAGYRDRAKAVSC